MLVSDTRGIPYSTFYNIVKKKIEQIKEWQAKTDGRHRAYRKLDRLFTLNKRDTLDDITTNLNEYAEEQMSKRLRTAQRVINMCFRGVFELKTKQEQPNKLLLVLETG